MGLQGTVPGTSGYSVALQSHSVSTDDEPLNHDGTGTSSIWYNVVVLCCCSWSIINIVVVSCYWYRLLAIVVMFTYYT